MSQMPSESLAPPRRRPWRMAFLLFVVFLLGGAAVVLAGRIRMEAPQQPAVFVLFHLSSEPGLLGKGVRSREEMESFARKQSALIRGRIVLNAALRNPGVADLPSLKADSGSFLDKLEKSIEVTFPDGPEVMRVVLRGRDEQQAILLLSAIATSYVTEAHLRERQSAQQRAAHLQDIARRYENRVQSMQQSMRKVREQTRDRMNLELRQQANEQGYLHGQRELRRIRLALAAASVRLERGKGEAQLEKEILLAQEKLLKEEGKRLLTTEWYEALDPGEFEYELKSARSQLETLRQRILVLQIESEAPPRVTWMQDQPGVEPPKTLSLWEWLIGAGGPRR